MPSLVFVCLGNICRSPTAEGVVRHRAEERGLNGQLAIDSAGTSGYHAGEQADERMRVHASRRGYDLTSRSRRFEANDFDRFDLVVAMDRSNRRDLESIARTEEERSKIVMFCDFVPGRKGDDVPDPYYGGSKGFEEVLDLIEAGADAVIDRALASGA